MATMGPACFVLTNKGSEELSLRTYRLDIKLRSLLVLIQKCSPTLEAVLQKSIFPREEALERLRVLVKDQFVALDNNAAREAPSTINASKARPGPGAAGDALDPGISLSQARFGLSDFCLDSFGVDAQPLVDVINAAGDLPALQSVVDDLLKRVSGQEAMLATLRDRIRDINESRV